MEITVPGKWANGKEISYIDKMAIALLRQAGCKCELPLIGWRPPDVTPRCSVCNTEITYTDPEPQGWPPQLGDVWKIGSRYYHCIGEKPDRLYPSSGRGYEWVTLQYALTREPELKFRP